MKLDGAKLKSCVERIMRLHEHIDELKGDIADIYVEGKSAQIVPKVLRQVVRRKRAKDPAAILLEEDLLKAYLDSLDGRTREIVELAERGATTREIEQATGIDHATVARAVAPKKKRATPKPDAITPASVSRLPAHDSETGEIYETPVAAVPEGMNQASHPAPPDIIHAASPTQCTVDSPQPDTPREACATGDHSVEQRGAPNVPRGSEQDGGNEAVKPDTAATLSCGADKPSVSGSSEGVASTSGGDARVTAGPQDPIQTMTVKADTRTFDEIVGTLPAYLDRRHERKREGAGR